MTTSNGDDRTVGDNWWQAVTAMLGLESEQVVTEFGKDDWTFWLLLG